MDLRVGASAWGSGTVISPGEERVGSAAYGDDVLAMVLA